jgi:hypothetical protein
MKDVRELKGTRRKEVRTERVPIGQNGGRRKDETDPEPAVVKISPANGEYYNLTARLKKRMSKVEPERTFPYYRIA